MLGGFLSRALLLAFGYAYPAYKCYKTVELNKPEIEHLIFWCQYWILVAILTVLERFRDVAISWLPLYSEAKLMFFIYLWCPKTKGTTYVYETLFRPYISQHEKDIDRNWEKSATLGQNTFFNILKNVAALESSSQLSRSHPSQGYLWMEYGEGSIRGMLLAVALGLEQRSQSQKQKKSQPTQQQQVPQKQPTTLRRAASAAARQEQETQTATTASKSRCLTTVKSAPVAPAKSIPVASTPKPFEETKTNVMNLAAVEAPGPVSDANAPIHDTNTSRLPEPETDDMVIDEDVVTTEDIVELVATPETTPMEAAIRPIFLEGEGQADFEELIDELHEAAGAIGHVVDADSVINKVFYYH
ncbi:putative HVA22-like protein g [Panicum miliaceum]|uniref:HVA22-like protein n=1 Tax=Panicum miliaceum TaxID=4540 RepID=A0A3L6SEY7_PANMI|nr:putative HVA22-like protein g [Panicum miliaceum]